MKTEKAIFAAGCFWGVEYYFQRAEGVISTLVGFIGGDIEHPSYNEVCSGRTGHAEAVEVVFDTSKTTFESLAKYFFEIHNPALIGGSNKGKRSQYRSAIFYTSGEQKEVAEKLAGMLRDKGYDVATELAKGDAFYRAEEYHQNYYNKKGKNDYGYRYKHKF